MFGREEYPERLSDWGVVAVAGHRLVLADDAVPYDLATPLFTDYAHKLRTMWMPPGTSATYDAADVFDFPVGTVISKTFYYPKGDSPGTVLATEAPGADSAAPGLDLNEVRLVETRLLVRQRDGWDALPYVWNDAQNEAVLEIAGDLVPLRARFFDGERTLDYLVPTRNDCTSCHATDHTARQIRPIGLAARHLEKIYARYASGATPQLTRWQQEGLLTGYDAATPVTPNASWDPAARDDLAHRARSYLDINCSHCHNPAGAGDTSGLFLHMAETSARRLGFCKPTVAAGRGSGGRKASIVPGRPDESILMFRMESADPAEMMPELGRTIVHAEGVALVRDWISSLDGDCRWPAH